MGLILNRRREMGGEEVLPSGAKKISYIQGSGAQYINTSYIPTINTKIEMSFNVTAYSTYNMVIGSRTTHQVDSYSIYLNNNGNSFDYQIGNGYTTNVRTSPSNIFGIDISLSMSKSLVSLGQYSSTPQSSTLNSSQPLYVFTCNQSGSPFGASTGGCAMKLYSLKIYENNTLVRDFIPVRINQTGYIYDKLNKTFLGNAGSGSFTLGPDV